MYRAFTPEMRMAVADTFFASPTVATTSPTLFRKSLFAGCERLASRAASTHANGSPLQLTIYIFDGVTPIIRLLSEVSTLLNVNRSALADLVA